MTSSLEDEDGSLTAGVEFGAEEVKGNSNKNASLSSSLRDDKCSSGEWGWLKYELCSSNVTSIETKNLFVGG